MGCIPLSALEHLQKVYKLRLAFFLIEKLIYSVNFCCIAKYFSYMYMFFFIFLFIMIYHRMGICLDSDKGEKQSL